MEPLTPREAEVARMVAAARSYKSIAGELGISVTTVQAHVLNAASKLPGGGTPRMKLVLFVVEEISTTRKRSGRAS